MSSKSPGGFLWRVWCFGGYFFVDILRERVFADRMIDPSRNIETPASATERIAGHVAKGWAGGRGVRRVRTNRKTAKIEKMSTKGGEKRNAMMDDC